jgi:microsomal dipeptidase-like Zn-dependent dipeptidase
MLIDLHAHYPMRVIGSVRPDSALREARRLRGRPRLRDKVRALVLRIASAFFSHRNPFSGYRVTVDGMRAGGVGVAFSVLTRPFDEVALGLPYASPPKPAYFDGLLEELDVVEGEIAGHDRDTVRLVGNRQQLEQALGDRATALVHAVEGGFSLGEDVETNVATLSERGVGYITLAHLLYRQVATNCSAFPFLADRPYRWVFPQPAGEGLTERGARALRAMVRHRVLLDVAHMRADALAEAFALLDEADPGLSMPVVATHAGFRFGKQEYMLDEPTLLQIKRRDGVVGLIMAQHQLNDGLRRTRTRTFDDSRAVVFAHIDRIAEITGGHRHVALGTDFDGFIKPTLTGLERMADLARLEAALEERYGDDARLIASENALRVLRRLWP